MIFETNTKREANRIASAITTMTGYQPTIFRLDGGGYRVQENDYGTRWEEALGILLSQPHVRADRCTRDRVLALMEELGL